MVEAIKKVNIVQPVVAGNAVKRQVRRAMKKMPKSRKPVYKRVPKIEKWAKAILHFQDINGGTLNCTIQGVHKSWKDGETATEPLAIFEEHNENCKVVKRRHRSGGDREGKYVQTDRYEPRLWWEIIERFDKKTTVDVIDEEATKAQNG